MSSVGEMGMNFELRVQKANPPAPAALEKRIVLRVLRIMPIVNEGLD